jgi:hypothetical protein
VCGGEERERERERERENRHQTNRRNSRQPYTERHSKGRTDGTKKQTGREADIKAK